MKKTNKNGPSKCSLVEIAGVLDNNVTVDLVIDIMQAGLEELQHKPFPQFIFIEG